MSILASTLCLSAIAAAGDIEFSGVGQTVVTSLDGVETLDTRLVLGAYGESKGAVYGFAFETNDNLDDTTLWEAYVGADLGGVDVTVGRFQRNFSAELAMSEYTYGVGLTNSSVFGLNGVSSLTAFRSEETSVMPLSLLTSLEMMSLATP